MPTVVVSWKGQCTDRGVQAGLVKKLTELSRLSSKLYKSYFDMEVNPLVFTGETVEKNVLVPAGFFPEKDRQNVTYPTAGNGKYFILPEIQLFGIQFPICDARVFYVPSNIYQISFVFIRSDDPNLNGKIVQVSLCGYETRQKGVYSMFLLSPCIDIRYCFDMWVPRILGWVKKFWIPGLEYWAYVENPDFSQYKRFNPASPTARNNRFRIILREYEYEARSIGEEILEDMKANGRPLTDKRRRKTLVFICKNFIPYEIAAENITKAEAEAQP